MLEFLQDNFTLVLLAALLLFYIWIAASSKRRQAKSDVFLEQARLDADRSKEHMLAVEQKLDRLIELLESDGSRDA